MYFYFNSNESIPCTFIVTEKFPPYTSTPACIYAVILICFQPVLLIHPTCTVTWNVVVPFNMLSLVHHLSLRLFIIPLNHLVLIYFVFLESVPSLNLWTLSVSSSLASDQWKMLQILSIIKDFSLYLSLLNLLAYQLRT